MCRSCIGILDISVYPGDVKRTPPFTSMPADVLSMYQEYLCKNLTEKYHHVNNQLDRVVNNANTQLQNLQKKITGQSWRLLSTVESD